ncbi:Siphovirus Gp37-like protein, partial [uncultured Caudovirales phage]
MAPIYTMTIYNASGTIQTIATDYMQLSINRQVNAIDGLTFNMASTSPNAQYLQYGYIVSVTRQDTAQGITASVEFSGMIRKIVRIVSTQTIYQITAVSMMALLADRVVAYRANVANRSVFSAVPAETVLKTLFNYNCTVLAVTGTTSQRIINGNTTGMTTAASAGSGSTVSIACSMQNLLDTMQKVAIGNGGDFDMIWTAPATYTFTWYLGQRGTNRSSSVILSVTTGTIAELQVITDRVQDFTNVVLGGSGESLARNMYSRPASLNTGLSNREQFIDSRNQGAGATAANYNTIGDSALALQTKKRTSYVAKLTQNAALKYGRDYFFGDLVTINDGGTLVVQKVQGVDLKFDNNGSETVNVR